MRHFGTRCWHRSCTEEIAGTPPPVLMGIRTKLCEARGFGVSRSPILRSTDAMTPYRERDRYGAFAVQLLINAAFSPPLAWESL